MYLTSLPNHNSAEFNEKVHFDMFARQNVLVNAVAKSSQCERHAGCLSLKFVTKGEEYYSVNSTQLVTRPGNFLLLNDGQEYGSRINYGEPVSTRSVFFTRDFAAAVFYDWSSNADILLDRPFETTVVPEFFQGLYQLKGDLMALLNKLFLKLDSAGYTPDSVDEGLIGILHSLFYHHYGHVQVSGNILGEKPGTRHEIYKRLTIARSVIESCYKEKLGLEAIARLSCMSVPQLVRQFRAVYKITPHQYLIKLRLEYAAGLLSKTDKTIQEITWDCGFEDASSFCRLFRNHYHLSPTTYRSRVNLSNSAHP
jgi:AraC family transcriptional regulator